MNKLTEQLKESLDVARGIKTEYSQIFSVIMLQARALLTEHENLEQEVEAGTNIRNELKRRVSKMESNKEVLPPEFFNGYRQAYAEMDRTADYIYRTACEK